MCWPLYFLWHGIKRLARIPTDLNTSDSRDIPWYMPLATVGDQYKPDSYSKYIGKQVHLFLVVNRSYRTALWVTITVTWIQTLSDQKSHAATTWEVTWITAECAGKYGYYFMGKVVEQKAKQKLRTATQKACSKSRQLCRVHPVRKKKSHHFFIQS